MQGKTIYTATGETVTVTNNWTAEAEARGTSVASSAWEWLAGGSVSGAALTGNSASVSLTATGSGSLKNTATLADGEVLVMRRDVVCAA